MNPHVYEGEVRKKESLASDIIISHTFFFWLHDFVGGVHALWQATCALIQKEYLYNN